MKRIILLLFSLSILFQLSNFAYGEPLSTEQTTSFLQSVINKLEDKGFLFYGKDVPNSFVDDFIDNLNKEPWNKINTYFDENKIKIDYENFSGALLPYGKGIYTNLKTPDDAPVFLTAEEAGDESNYHASNYIAFINSNENGRMFYFVQFMVNKNNFFKSKIRTVFPNGIGSDITFEFPFFKKVESQNVILEDSIIKQLLMDFCRLLNFITLGLLVICLIGLVIALTLAPLALIWYDEWIIWGSISMAIGFVGFLFMFPMFACMIITSIIK